MPPFFYAATKTAKDVDEVLTKVPLGSLPLHPLGDYIFPLNQWRGTTLHDMCTNFFQVLEVYVDDFCSIVQTSNVAHLRQVSRRLLHAIHSVFPFPAITGHAGVDPVSLKKIYERGRHLGCPKRNLRLGF